MDTDVPSISQKREIITRAITNSQNIRFEYERNSINEKCYDKTEISIRTVLPLELTKFHSKDFDYVKGYCFMRENERTFSIYKMVNISVNPTSIQFCEYVEDTYIIPRVLDENINTINFFGLIPPGKHVVLVEDAKIVKRLDPEEPEFLFKSNYLQIIFRLPLQNQFIKVYLPLMEFKRINEINNDDIIGVNSEDFGISQNGFQSLTFQQKLEMIFTSIPNKKGSPIAVANCDIGKKKDGSRVYSKVRTNTLLEAIHKNLLRCDLIKQGELDNGQFIKFDPEGIQAMVGRRVCIIVKMGGDAPNTSRVPFVEKIMNVNDR